jgi:hypothetical protein
VLVSIFLASEVFVSNVDNHYCRYLGEEELARELVMLGYRCTMTYTLKTDKQTETKTIKARDLPRHKNDQQAESLFYFNFLKYFFQHCYLCRTSDSTVLEGAGIEPKTVATIVLAVRRFFHSAIEE